MNFWRGIELRDQIYQANGYVRDENYKESLLFYMKDFVSFGRDIQSMYFMSTKLLKYNINGVRFPQFQIAYINDTTRRLHKNLIKMYREVHYMWWVNQEL